MTTKKKQQTRTTHVNGAAPDLSAWAKEITITGQNDAWTSFTPKKPTAFDAVPISKALDCDVWDQWFIEGDGIVGRWYSRGFVVGVFALPARDGSSTAKDLAEVMDLGDIGTAASWKLMKKLAKDPKALREWTLAHGLEKALGLPEAAPAKKPPPKKVKAKAKATPRKLR